MTSTTASTFEPTEPPRCPAHERAAPFTTQVFTGHDELRAIVERWNELSNQEFRPHIDQHHALVLLREQSRMERLTVVGLLQDDALVGVSPVTRDQTKQHGWRLRLPGRDVKLVDFRLLQGQFYGDSLVAPDTLEAQRTLLRGVIEACRDCQILAFTNVDCGSKLYRLLTTERWSPFRWHWSPREPWSRWMIHLDGSFDDYLQKQFSPRRRHELRRERRRFEENCPEGLKVTVVTSPDDVEAYVAQVSRVVDASWQGRRYPGWPRGAKTLRTMREQAELGLFRGYLTSNGDEPIAFTCGCIADGVYAPERTAYDPKWSPNSPGKHLWLAVLKDLFDSGVARWLDFGRCDLWYKEFLSNHQHDENAVYLIRGHWRPLAALAPSIVGRAGLRLTAGALRPLGLDTKLRRLLYRISRGRVGNR